MKKSLALIVGFMLLGAVLRVFHIGFNGLWFDEVFSRNVAVDLNAITIARNGVAGDVHPPLYFMLLSLWVRLVGDSDVVLRFLSALFMILALPAFYHLGRLAADRRVGMVMLMLGAVSPFQIYYAQEARQYALSVLMVSWAFVGLSAALQKKRGGWWLYAAGMLGGLYTHYFTGLLFATVNIFLLLYSPLRRQWAAQWRYWLAANIGVVVLFIPQLTQFLHQTQAVFSSFWIDKPNPAAPLATLAFLLFSTTLPRIVQPIAIACIVCLLVLAVLDIRRRAPRRIFQLLLLCLFAIIMPMLIVMVISLGRTSLYLDKSFGLLSPLLLLVLALGIVYWKPPSPARLLAGLLVILMVVGLVKNTVQSDAAKPPYREIASNILASDPSGATILHLHDSSYLPVLYYADDLKGQMQLVNLEDRSWLYPKTWEIFGVNRIDRTNLKVFVANYKGRLIVIVPANTELPEQATLLQLQKIACSQKVMTYSQSVQVFDFQLNNC